MQVSKPARANRAGPRRSGRAWDREAFVGVKGLAWIFRTAGTVSPSPFAGERQVHVWCNGDKERHHGNRAFAQVVDHDDGDAGFAVDRAAPERNVVVDLRADDLESADVAGSDVGHDCLFRLSDPHGGGKRRHGRPAQGASPS